MARHAPPPLVADAPVAVDGSAADETAADLLARLRVAVDTGRLPRDVGEWAVEVCQEHLPATQRRMVRDRLLRQAANLVTGSSWAKARYLQKAILEARGLRSHHARFLPRAVSVGYFVERALRVDPETPASVRQVLRIVS